MYYYFRKEKKADFLNGHTQLYITKKLDVNISYLSCILNGHYHIKSKMLHKMLDYVNFDRRDLNENIDYLNYFFYEDKENS